MSHPMRKVTPHRVDTGIPPRYEYRGWTIAKEFYADGPSMYLWSIWRPDGSDSLEARRTRRAAAAYVDGQVDGSLDTAR